MLQAVKLKKGLDEIARAKENAIREKMGLPPVMTFRERCERAICLWWRVRVLNSFLPCCLYDPEEEEWRVKDNSCLGRTFFPNTYENKIFKQWLCFFFGLTLSFAWFWLMCNFLGYGLLSSLVVCIVMGFIFSLGMAYSTNIRCLVLLALPQVFTSKGRTVLLSVTFVLVITGPMANFKHNIMVMSQTQTCGQELAYNATRAFVDIATAPMAGLLGTIRSILQGIKQFVLVLRESFMKVRRMFEEIAAAIKRLKEWLMGMVDVCNERMGGPYRRCHDSLKKVENSCKKKLGPMKFMCKIMDLIGKLCKIFKVAEAICGVTKRVSKMVMDKVKLKVALACDNIYEMFYFNVSLDYHYVIEFNQSKTFDQVRQEIFDDIKSKMQPVLVFTSISHVVLILSLVYLVLKAVLYKHKYLTNERFDNYYITTSVKLVNDKREEMGKETALPLLMFEGWRYVTTTSPILAGPERTRLISGIILLSLSALHAYFYVACDYGLYWILETIRVNGELKTIADVPPHVKIHVQGKGVLSDMYRSLISQMDPTSKINLEIDTTPCLPNPSPPDTRTYQRIGNIFVVCLVLVLTESYGLRLRHVVAGCYFPKRQKERAVWLFNNILRRRGGFLRFLRRKLRKKNQSEKEAAKISFMSKLVARNPLFGRIASFMGWKEKYCIVCGLAGKPDDEENFVHCATLDCKTCYCQDCFTDINNLCTVCMNPVDYGDFSDVSEERDSSGGSDFDREIEEEKSEKQKAKEEKLRKQEEMVQFIQNAMKDVAGLKASPVIHKNQNANNIFRNRNLNASPTRGLKRLPYGYDDFYDAVNYYKSSSQEIKRAPRQKTEYVSMQIFHQDDGYDSDLGDYDNLNHYGNMHNEGALHTWSGSAPPGIITYQPGYSTWHPYQDQVDMHPSLLQQWPRYEPQYSHTYHPIHDHTYTLAPPVQLENLHS